MHLRRRFSRSSNLALWTLTTVLAAMAYPGLAGAQDHSTPKTPGTQAGSGKPATAKEIGAQVKEAVEGGAGPTKRLMLTINGKEKSLIAMPETPGMNKPVAPSRSPPNPSATTTQAAAPMVVAPGSIPNPAASRQYIRAKAAALAGQTPSGSHADGEVHWSYEGATGPAAWGRLKPEFNVCAIGRRQSPINIDESATLRGPAEPIQFDYAPSGASVVNNGHTIQVDMSGDNAITVRGSSYKLLQFHFHHPSEEQVNDRSFAMVAHLVHRNSDGQLAVVAVLLEPGAINNLINKVWTYMPLDAGDRVRMPGGLVDMSELLPKDQRYYQFIGSLTTPPCKEGVLWMVLKQPVSISREQLRLFRQLFPNNARPPQPVNGRAIRDAQ
jgi:carbonic anhydrase